MVPSLSDRLSLQALQVAKEDKHVFDLLDTAGIADRCFLGPPPASFYATDFFEKFLFWFPKHIPCGRSVSVTSSRLSRKLETYTNWFDALRTLAVRLAQEDSFLISMAETTTHPFLTRISELFSVPLVNFEAFPDSVDRAWVQSKLDKAKSETAYQTTAYVKPIKAANSLRRDQLLNGIASKAVGLSIRSGGNVFKSLESRLNSPSKPPTQILVDNKLTSAKTRNKLVDHGACEWWLYGYDPKSTNTKAVPDRDATSRKIEPVVLSLDEIKDSNFLLHWTRRRVGAWPDQSQTEYLDDLIFKNNRGNHCEFSALCRILASRRILGSNQLTRDPRDVVCFSDIPITELPDRRVFRPHLSRWDFEPYGIAIDRDLLGALGSQPVVYGKESDWLDMPNDHRPFFQLQSNKSESIDWREEQEWRILGDLNLDNIPRDQAIVFVASVDEAQTIAQLCHWPIVVISESSAVDP